MRVLIRDTADMIGVKLAARLTADGAIAVRDITAVHLVNIVEPQVPLGAENIGTTRAVDISADGVAQDLVALRADVIFHFAAIVSGAAERDFCAGYRINLDATLDLFDAIRHAHLADGYCPRLIFTSWLALYGTPLPDPIPDDHIRAPHTSYGTQKAITELLLDDCTRRGFFDGIGIYLPTVLIRPGAPNTAACHSVAWSMMPYANKDDFLPTLKPFAIMKACRVNLLPFFLPGVPAKGTAVGDLVF